MQSCSPSPFSRPSEHSIGDNVRTALAEDMGNGDITAQLIPVDTQGKARIITREAAILCGQDWVNEAFHQVDASIQLHWLVTEGSAVEANQTLVELSGSLRHLLTAERTALNFLQLLSGTATTSHAFAERVKHTSVKLLDTRKTIPGLRLAQKYAVQVGGCFNHRLGLYDAFLIKENHIAACGNIATAITRARTQSPGKAVEVEVENFDELQQALAADANIIMLDNFSLIDMAEAVRRVRASNKACALEASGGINNDNLIAIAETGVDYISIGCLTKNLRAIDLSMRVL